MSAENHKQALPLGFPLGAYNVVRVLGVGGFGVTYLCEHAGLDVQVAVKEYLPNEIAVRDGTEVHPKSADDREGFEWGLSRFLGEAGTLACFRHPNVVRVRYGFEANNTAYIVMDYEDGKPLDELLRRHGTLTEVQLKRFLLPVVDGLRQVHAAGFLHRDIKPTNIFLRRSDESPVLLDFGSARQALGRRSRRVTAIASAGYSPPEQYESDSRHGAWTDIYALSALCYRAITGDAPVEATQRQSQLLRAQTDPLPRLAEIPVSTCSPAFLEAVDWGLRLIDAERPQSLDEWLPQLGRATTHRGYELEPEQRAEGETTAATTATPLKWEMDVRKFGDSVTVDTILQKDADTYMSVSGRDGECLDVSVRLPERLRSSVRKAAIRFGDEAPEIISVEIGLMRVSSLTPPLGRAFSILTLRSNEELDKEETTNSSSLAWRLTQHSKFRLRYIGESSTYETTKRIDLTFEYDKDSAKEAISKVFKHYGYELAQAKWTVRTVRAEINDVVSVGAMLWKDPATYIVVACVDEQRLAVFIYLSEQISPIWPINSEKIAIRFDDKEPETIYVAASKDGFSSSDNEEFNTAFGNYDAVELARRLARHSEFGLRYQGVELTFEYENRSAKVAIGEVLEHCGYEM